MKKINYYTNIIFYISLIICLSSFFISGLIHKNDPNKKAKQEMKISNFRPIEAGNYKFDIQVSIDGKKSYYKGDRYLHRAHFIYSDEIKNKEYFMIEDIFLVRNNGEYVLSTDPTIYFNFLDNNLIKTILLSKDKNDEISNSKLHYILTGESINEDKKYNKIETVVKDKIIRSIKMDLSNYINILGRNSKVIITMNYSNFSSILKLDIA